MNSRPIIVLRARRTFANILTEGKVYTAIKQTPTGFLLTDDCGDQIDLYANMFDLGICVGDEYSWMEQRKAAAIQLTEEAKEIIENQPKEEAKGPKTSTKKASKKEEPVKTPAVEETKGPEQGPEPDPLEETDFDNMEFSEEDFIESTDVEEVSDADANTDDTEPDFEI
jgi:hypothetical protein